MTRPVQIREDVEKGHKCNLEEVVALAEQNKWPTPAARDYKGANSLEHCEVNGTGRKHMDQLPNAVVHRDTAEPSGQLNPAWVEWLMGWPIGWTRLEEITELDWRDWETDPADDLPALDVSTPTATMSVRSEQFRGMCKAPIPNEVASGKINDSSGWTERIKNNATGPIPRVATGIKHRVGRLKAIGNGQVPQVAAMAWEILTNE